MDPVVLIFGGLAAFILFRLVSLLGARTGHEQRRDEGAIKSAARPGEASQEGRAADQGEAAARAVCAAAEPLRAADPAFDEKVFLEGARTAYEMIVEGFAAGDLKSIRRFVSQSVYDAFRSAVGTREALGHTPELKFVGVDRASIVSSEVAGGVMSVVTEFASNQVRVTRGRDGAVVDGDPNRIDLVKDRWTFSRKARSNDPNWILVATGSAG